MAIATAPAHRPSEWVARLKSINWFHRIDLGGVVTPGVDDTPTKLAQVRLPNDLTGLSVLDIGTWDGFFAFEAERRGAARVVALDGGVWHVGSIGRAGFDFAHHALHSRVEAVECDVHHLGPSVVGGTFDLVLFLGVLYHTPHPMTALRNVAGVCSGMLILETHVDLLHVNRPAIAFYPGDECADDDSNWVGPNPPAVEAMLKAAGFTRVVAFPPTRVPYTVRGARRRQIGRLVCHAWK